VFNAEIGIFMFAWILGPFDPKWRFWGQNRGSGGVMLTSNELVVTSGFVTSVPLLAKIDQEMRP